MKILRVVIACKMSALLIISVLTRHVACQPEMGAFPAIAGNVGSGTMLFANDLNPGVYNIKTTIYSSAAKVVRQSTLNGYTILDGSHTRIFDSWDLRNKYGNIVGGGTYKMVVDFTNTTSPQKSHTLSNKMGVKIDKGDYPGDMGFSFFWTTGATVFRKRATNPSQKRRAVIFLEGFDPFNRNGFWKIVAGAWFLIMGHESAESKGWDVYLVNWRNGGLHIHENARSLEHVVEQVAGQENYTEIALVGKSMGGVIARYALLKREQQGNPLPVTKFISLDSPQAGAQINLSFQGVIYYLNLMNFRVQFAQEFGFGGAYVVQESWEMLSCGAAKDMLNYHAQLVFEQVKTKPENECVFRVADLPELRTEATLWHDRFYGEMESMGGMPQRTKNYAISYGVGNATPSSWLPNRHSGTFDVEDVYHVYSDPEDVATGGYIDYASQSGGDYKGMGGFPGATVFIPLESALLLRNPPRVSNGSVAKMTREQLRKYSAFDEVYTRPGSSYNHMGTADDLVADFINDALNDDATLPDRSSIRLLCQPRIPIERKYMQ